MKQPSLVASHHTQADHPYHKVGHQVGLDGPSSDLCLYNGSMGEQTCKIGDIECESMLLWFVIVTDKNIVYK
jgi:hypothetical protein